MSTCGGCGAPVPHGCGCCSPCRRRGLLTGVPADLNPHLLFNGPPFPVSAVCPQCRGEADRAMRARPWIWAGLWTDRACTRCMLGFRPPRPVWAKALYLGSLTALLTLLAVPIGSMLICGEQPLWLDAAWLPLAFLAANVFLLMVQMRE